MHPQNLPKGPLFSDKMGQNWGFCKRVKGDEVQKVHFWGPKGPHFGGSAPPIDAGYRPGHG